MPGCQKLQMMAQPGLMQDDFCDLEETGWVMTMNLLDEDDAEQLEISQAVKD